MTFSLKLKVIIKVVKLNVIKLLNLSFIINWTP